jgi:hypothetical protein
MVGAWSAYWSAHGRNIDPWQQTVLHPPVKLQAFAASLACTDEPTQP